MVKLRLPSVAAETTLIRALDVARGAERSAVTVNLGTRQVLLRADDMLDALASDGDIPVQTLVQRLVEVAGRPADGSDLFDLPDHIGTRLGAPLSFLECDRNPAHRSPPGNAKPGSKCTRRVGHGVCGGTYN